MSAVENTPSIDVSTSNRTFQFATRIAILSVILLAVALLAPLGFRRTSEVSEQAASIPADNTGSRMTPAMAAVSGVPTVLYFYPVDVCQMRYCRQPVDVEAQLLAEYGSAVNFVLVETRTLPAGSGAESAPALAFENWDLYPVPPYDGWLPELTETAHGVGLLQAELLIVNGNAKPVRWYGEFFSWDEIRPLLDALLAEQVLGGYRV